MTYDWSGRRGGSGRRNPRQIQGRSPFTKAVIAVPFGMVMSLPCMKGNRERGKEHDGSCDDRTGHRTNMSPALPTLFRTKGCLLSIGESDGVDIHVQLAASPHGLLMLSVGDGRPRDAAFWDDHGFSHLDFVQHFEMRRWGQITKGMRHSLLRRDSLVRIRGKQVTFVSVTRRNFVALLASRPRPRFGPEAQAVGFRGRASLKNRGLCGGQGLDRDRTTWIMYASPLIFYER